MTWVGVEDAKPGTYTVTPLPGSAPIGSVSETRPDDETGLRVRVTGSGRRRVLRYTLENTERRTVELFERGNAVFRPLGTTRGRRGRIRFSPAPGPAGQREIVARVSLDGDADGRRGRRALPRRRRRGPAARAGSASGAAGRRCWRRGVAARTPPATASCSSSATARRRCSSCRAARRSARFRGIPLTQGGTVSVRTLGVLRDYSGARTGRFRARRKAPTRLRPFAKLGRR